MFQVKVSQMHVDQEVSLYSTSIIRVSKYIGLVQRQEVHEPIRL